MHIPVRTYYALWAVIAIVYVCNLSLDVMEVDAAQYASISAEMAQSGNVLHVYQRGTDYLDKPPLLFWLSAFAFKLLGVSNVAYKLPALLVLLLGLWSVYRFALLYDTRETGLMAVTILGSTQAYFLMTNDVRTDGLLTGFVMFAVYHCAAYLQHRKWSSLLFAGVGIGMAMLAKGPIGAAIPVIAIATDRLCKGKWRDLFDVRWIVVLITAVVLLLPMCYGLYTQFDLHPEKIVYDLQGPSGLRFFFWTQSFGRITGDIYWHNHAPFYYFPLTFLWDFMPWTTLFIAGVIYAVRRIIVVGKKYPEFATIGGFFIVMFLLSFSHYKLPHYIFPIFPFGAILTARFLTSVKPSRALQVAQMVLLHLFFVLIVYGYFMVFPPRGWLMPVLTVVGFLSVWLAVRRFQGTRRIMLITTITAITFNAFLAVHFYPQLLRYQSGAQAGRLIHADKQHTHRNYYSCDNPSYTMDFYAGKYLPLITSTQLDTVAAGAWIYVDDTVWQRVHAEMPEKFTVVKQFDHFHVSMLKLPFLNRRTRASQVQKRYLIESLPIAGRPNPDHLQNEQG